MDANTDMDAGPDPTPEPATQAPDREVPPLARVLPSAVRLPSVSMVVTNYNYARFIGDCLESIAAQTYPDFDCVIVDDVSTDDSAATVERMLPRLSRPERFRLVRHERNGGQMAAILTGLDQTTGRLVAFIDADDILMPDFIDAHVKAHLNSEYPAAFTCSDHIQIDAEGQILAATQDTTHAKQRAHWHQPAIKVDDRNRWHPDHTEALVQRTHPLLFIPPKSDLWAIWPWTSTSGMMFRRDVIDVIRPTETETMRICADAYLCQYAHGIGGSLVISTAHGFVRLHGGNGFTRSPMVGARYTRGDLRRVGHLHLIWRAIFDHAAAQADRLTGLMTYGNYMYLLERFGTAADFRRSMAAGVSTIPPDVLRRKALKKGVVAQIHRVRHVVNVLRNVLFRL